MKTISKEVPTFGKVWAKIRTESHGGFAAHTGASSVLGRPSFWWSGQSFAGRPDLGVSSQFGSKVRAD
jgi:hypothetical protein